MRKLIPFVLLMATACGDDVTTPPSARTFAVPPAPEFASVRQDQPAGGGAQKSASVNIAAAEIPKKLIRNGDVRILVKDVEQSSHRADSLIKKFGGELANSALTQQPKLGHEQRLTVRVPSAQFDEAVAAFGKLGEVQYQNLGVQDITKAYLDLETRLALKEQTLTRLRALLDNRTARLSDVLDVERESNRVIEEIETLKGERRFYDQQIAMSTLVLTFYEDQPVTAGQFSTPIINTLHRSLELLGTSLGGLLFAIIMGAPWFIALAAAWWLFRKFGPQRKTPTQVAP